MREKVDIATVCTALVLVYGYYGNLKNRYKLICVTNWNNLFTTSIYGHLLIHFHLCLGT